MHNSLPCSPPDSSITALWEDTALLVLAKPAGLLSVPGRGPHLQDCMAARAQALWPDARIVHRLDMATSGLLVMGRGAAAQRQLSISFAERRVHKEYTAVVHGLVAEDCGSIDLPLICDWPNRPRQIVDHQRGKPALTHWQVIGRDPGQDTTRLRLEPVTGRSHQLRVHLQSIGHPIVGDELYAEPHRFNPGRMWLHASRLVLPHPAHGQMLTFADTAPF